MILNKSLRILLDLYQLLFASIFSLKLSYTPSEYVYFAHSNSLPLLSRFLHPNMLLLICFAPFSAPLPLLINLIDFFVLHKKERKEIKLCISMQV